MFRRFLRCYSTLTKDRFPEIKRGNYAVLQDADVSFFEKVLNKNQIITDADEVDSYNKDWLNMVCGMWFIPWIFDYCIKDNLITDNVTV